MGLHRIEAWQMEAGKPELVRTTRELDGLAPGEVLIEVAGCGVCHTDLGFFFDGVRTGHALPLTLGHEIAGRVADTGPGAEAWRGRAVVVPAVMPCGDCELCRTGYGTICRAQKFFGSDVHGGFASHVVAPARGLCPVDTDRLAATGLELADLGVLADAISTPFQAIERAEVRAGDVTIFVGAGGVGGFGAQIAHALGAHVVAIDVDAARLEKLKAYGVDLTLDSRALDAKAIKAAIGELAASKRAGRVRWKIFETSGHPAGQELAFSLLTFGSILSVVGYTLEKVHVRLSNLMAFDAIARGNWGCVPERYPAALELILDQKIAVAPFIERRPMSRINETFAQLRAHELKLRPVLVPDFR
ncbi:MAG: 6-hydroxycyclohex-1-ene-1-carbonyl-CoA dehydrogenase [Deltaproteobacteria bacterium]|nr:6-hydroxycyclohex-1-ene-1-carbonyl-CoA dehydrogenase [Deltaproteobacteria bacterium]